MKRFLWILLIGILSLSSLQAQEMRVISFNIHTNSNPKADGENAWQFRRKTVVNMIKKEQPVILALQEAQFDQLSYLDRIFREQYRRIGIGCDNGLTRGHFSAIYYDFSKLELVFQRSRWLSDNPTRVSKGWDAGDFRILTIAKFRVRATGKEFYYFNTQLDNTGKEARKQSILLIQSYIKALVERDVPVIFGGDMNETINSSIFDPLIEINMLSARENAILTDNKKSFNGFGEKKAANFDHIFFRGIDIKEFHTLTRRYGVQYISNHYPLQIIFDL